MSTTAPVLVLSDTGQDPVRALELAEPSCAPARTSTAYDALAWALFANDRPEEAEVAMTTALAFGTRDAELLYHAGPTKAALAGVDPAAASESRELLGAARAHDPSFDPAEAIRALATLERRP